VESVPAGIVTLIVVLVFAPIALLLAGLVYEALAKAPQSSSGGVGWDPVSLLHQVPILGLLPGWTVLLVPLILIFAAGFYWEFPCESRKLAVR